jgi:V8-like Glu-specific endopeptidase
LIPGDTILNVAASTDTIGGSSGSPAINARGEIIGANFDSTVLTQRNAYGYDPEVNRSVLVTAAAVTAALRHAYGMEHLLGELGVNRTR